MKAYPYDLHVHSCLSPCGDADMTPQNIAGMASLNGLSVVALTDHNSTANCPAFFKAAERYGICPVAGMELTTAEEIHMLCLFPDLETAEVFDRFVTENRVCFPNKPDIFGEQQIFGEQDEVIDTIPYLLPSATNLTVDEAVKKIREMGAFICPAHIDKKSNAMVEILGTVPSSYGFSTVECHDRPDAAFIAAHGLAKTRILYDSDAHYLWEIADAQNCLHIDTDHPTAADVIACLLA